MDYAACFDAIVERVKGDVPTDQAMHEVIDLCARERPHTDWDRLRAIDYGAEAKTVASWFSALVSRLPPQASATGFWFGLYNPIRSGVTTSDIYVLGGTHDAANIDWASQRVWPLGHSDAESRALAEIYRIAYCGEESHLGNDAEYPLCLAFAALSVRDLMTQAAKNPMLEPSLDRYFYAGFDSGDAVCVGAIRAGRVVYSRSSETFEQ